MLLALKYCILDLYSFLLLVLGKEKITLYFIQKLGLQVNLDKEVWLVWCEGKWWKRTDQIKRIVGISRGRVVKSESRVLKCDNFRTKFLWGKYKN